MTRLVAVILVGALSTGCIFGSPSSENNGDGSDAGSTADSSVEPGDSGGGDDDLGSRPADLSESVALSAICTGEERSANVSGEIPVRLRVYANDTHLVGAVTRDSGAQVIGNSLDGLTGFVRSRGVDVPEVLGELLGGAITPTGLDVAQFQDSITFVATRRDARACVVPFATGEVAPIDCGGRSTTYGAALTNLSDAPRYFWFEEDGLISSMPYDDPSPAGQILVPWCISGTSGCRTLDFGAVDARGNGGPYVLLSDPAGRAYAWDTTQTGDDCEATLEPPLPLMFDGEPVSFEDVDLVWVGEYRAVRFGEGAVHSHPVTADFELEEPVVSVMVENGVELLDAATEGDRIAAHVRTSEGSMVVPFDGNSPMSAMVDPGTEDLLAGGIAVIGNDVGVILVTTGGIYGRLFSAW